MLKIIEGRGDKLSFIDDKLLFIISYAGLKLWSS
ncbi:hypothetical protein SAMN05421766_102227 [Zobellia uliginosa]|uniref:Uncharacterized protein n=1 Tax=Zobellia uliginosa TaxID=143224 RepID=A0ABY1KLR0_9FLAO|nr:hypothetical protein SAMN05421766_102227 [Zobellia uliginosa]